jgi:cell fate (sporulation/competence/biofilm development) regulator YlbF (YheA/YmcA/DUF963 family)
MSIYTAAHQLADEIANSAELQKVKECELKIMINMEARQIVEEYQRIQAEAVNAGMSYDDLPQDKKYRLAELEQKMSDDEIIGEYLKANDAFNAILETVNNLISDAINGTSEGGCASCPSHGHCGEEGTL